MAEPFAVKEDGNVTAVFVLSGDVPELRGKISFFF